jgi:hypothetical protein
LYRGVLGDKGKAYLKLFKVCSVKMMASGRMSEKEAVVNPDDQSCAQRLLPGTLSNLIEGTGKRTVALMIERIRGQFLIAIIGILRWKLPSTICRNSLQLAVSALAASGKGG